MNGTRCVSAAALAAVLAAAASACGGASEATRATPICRQSRAALLSWYAMPYHLESSGGSRCRCRPNQSWISWSQNHRATARWTSRLVGLKNSVTARLRMASSRVFLFAMTHKGEVVWYDGGVLSGSRVVVW